MKYSYNWLKELSGTKRSAEEIAQDITMRAFEVESVEKAGKDFAGVVVGKILEIKKHPNADKLQLVKVDMGEQILDIVCGAHNINVGDHVPVATVGTDLGGGFVIKEAEIRGEKSFGMLCALDELGLGEDHSGIMLLSKKTKIGTPFADTLPNNDQVLEIKVLPDRSHDAFSHVGMAREIAALEGKQLEYDYDELELPKKKTKKLSIKIEDSKLCPRYVGAIMENVVVKESPQWLKDRLEACGIRPINNIVDATNYVMLELGQPLHAFDCDVIKNEVKSEKVKVKSESVRIDIRKAKKGEKITLLDGSMKELLPEDIVIANEKHALALAGVMGGEDSGISDKTTKIVLEAANFDAVSIRKTRTRLNILTDAAYRFEKSIDPNLAEKAMVRVIEILEHIADGELEGILDVYPKKVKMWTVKLDLDYMDRLLGTTVPRDKARKILESLGMRTKNSGENVLIVEIPTFRLDAKTQEDLIDDIGRIYGYDKVSVIAPLVSVQAARSNENRIFEREVKKILVEREFSEIYNYSFYGMEDARRARIEESVHRELENPMNPDQAYMRVSLVPAILKNVRENLKYHKDLHIFEIGRIYPDKGETLPAEKTMLVGAVVPIKKNAKELKQDKRHASVFYEAKGYAQYLLGKLGISDIYFDTFEADTPDSTGALWHAGRTAEVKIAGSGRSIGFIGEVDLSVLADFDIDERVSMFEFDMDALNEVSQNEREYEPIRRYPIVTRDVALISPADVKVEQILSLIQLEGGNMIIDVDLFDIFDFADSTTSYAFHIMLGADDHTLTSQEIDDTMGNIIQKLKEDLGIEIRK
jgi:phenylalanyl-tRNA synthetase beta chain